MLTIELADVMLPEMEYLSVDPDQDSLPPITVGLYKAFMAKGKSGLVALQVYQHLLFSYRLQRTDIVQATNTYLQRGLHLGRNRIETAKRMLREMNVIGKPIRKRDAKGRTLKGQVYVRLHLLPNPGPSIAPETGDMEKSPEESIAPENHTHGFERQMLEEVKEKERVEQPSAEAKPTASPSPAKNKGPRTPHGRLRALFSELYVKNTMAARAPFNEACAGQLRNDLARLGEDRLARCVRWLFDHPPGRMKSFAYMSIHTFLPEAEKSLQAEDRRLSMVRVCLECGKDQEHTGSDCLFCGVPLKGARHVG